MWNASPSMDTSVCRGGGLGFCTSITTAMIPKKRPSTIHCLMTVSLAGASGERSRQIDAEKCWPGPRDCRHYRGDDQLKGRAERRTSALPGHESIGESIEQQR